jgi:DNA invertase Pin-like site-specific DNA recombinase
VKKAGEFAPRAALYVRVSTTRQAAHDLSIPDQIRQAEDYCASRGFEVVEIFEEPGASAVSDRRPQFRRMIEMATWTPPPFDLIIVHSYSRFFRDHFELEAHIRALDRNGVKLVSITQAMGDDPMAEMMRHIIALFDEYQSKETGKHVRRTQRENARQGFWNGSVPPVGYQAVVVEKRGSARKRKLEIDPRYADTIRLIYRLYLHGTVETGPLGVARIASHLNDQKIRAPGGGLWGLASVYRVLRRRTYTGELIFDERCKRGRTLPEGPIIRTAVPQIIDPDTFDAVQSLLNSRGAIMSPIGTRRPPYL